MYTDQDLAREIVQAAKACWNVEEAPLLISKLGLVGLSESARTYVRDENVSLKRFVRAHLADAIRFVPMPRQGGGVAPRAETNSMTDAQLEAAYLRSKAAGAERTARPRFYREVWAAFRDPIPDGFRRVISFGTDEHPNVSLIAASDTVADGVFEIEGHDTAITSDPDRQPTYAEIRNAITSWSEAKGISLASLTQPNTVSQAAVINENRQPGHGILDSVSFISVLRAIPPRQLSQISFPGDTLLSILERLNKQ